MGRWSVGLPLRSLVVAVELVGRAEQQAALGALADRGGSLLLRGAAGVGKSALLDALTAAAGDHRVLRATGVEAETAIAYAGLHQLLLPLLPLAGELDPAHRATLDAVTGGLPERAPSVMALGIAVLDLLSLAATRTSLLLIVDDGQWFDVPSVQACTFVARRLGELPVAFVIALRDGEASGFDHAGLDELTVPPLPAEEAGRVLDARFPGLTRDLRNLVLDQAAGNPLALVELPPSLIVGDLPEAGHLPLPRRLERIFANRIRALPGEERAELLRLALDPGYFPRDTDTAETVGLLHGRAFRHPLVASAVIQLASPNERRAAHALLARLNAADLERRAAHLAAATVDPDPAVAGALEDAARSAVRRGGAATAVQWLSRAAELHPKPRERARLLADAAYLAGQAGLLDRAQTLVAAADRADGRVASPEAVVTSAYVAFYREGDVGMLGVLADVIRRQHAELDDATLARLANLLLTIAQFAQGAAAWATVAEVLDPLRPRLPSLSLLMWDAWSDVVRHGAGLGRRLRDELAASNPTEPWDLMRLAVSASWVDGLADFRPYLLRMIERERAGGAVASLMTMLNLIILDDTAAGRWDDASGVADEVIALTGEHGYAMIGHQARAFFGIVLAMRGETTRAAELQATVDAWARPRRVGLLLRFAEEIGLQAALSEGDFETAWTYAVGLAEAGKFPPFAQHAARTLLDLVEAALHTGRDDLARAHADAAAALPPISPRFALLTAGAVAMTSPSSAGFAVAAEHPAAADFPFDAARIRHAEGVWLRRQRHITEARAAVADALTVFERLGAAGWADRARRELRAGAPQTETLTAQERQIAELAATGLSNKQIAGQLFLSPRTVGAHLYRIFPKLGITSRAALRDALEASV